MTSDTGLELEDPLEEDKDSPVPGLILRYPDRVLMVTTHVCSMYCRFCTRKRVNPGPRRLGFFQPQRSADGRLRPPTSGGSRCPTV